MDFNYFWRLTSNTTVPDAEIPDVATSFVPFQIEQSKTNCNYGKHRKTKTNE